jgi:hypothetical protein
MGAFARDKGLDGQEIAEVVELFAEDVVARLIEGPFEPEPQLYGSRGYKASRYSDGSWAVFYASAERGTSEKEIRYHKGLEPIAIDETRVIYYTSFRCDFAGGVIDLRPFVRPRWHWPFWNRRWPLLVSDDYAFCQGLGREAVKTNLGGFLAPSARAPGETTAPVFQKVTLSNGVLEGTTRFTFAFGNEPLVERL